MILGQGLEIIEQYAIGRRIQCMYLYPGKSNLGHNEYIKPPSLIRLMTISEKTATQQAHQSYIARPHSVG